MIEIAMIQCLLPCPLLCMCGVDARVAEASRAFKATSQERDVPIPVSLPWAVHILIPIAQTVRLVGRCACQPGCTCLIIGLLLLLRRCRGLSTEQSPASISCCLTLRHTSAAQKAPSPQRAAGSTCATRTQPPSKW